MYQCGRECDLTVQYGENHTEKKYYQLATSTCQLEVLANAHSFNIFPFNNITYLASSPSEQILPQD